MKNAIMFALGMLVLMSVALFMTPEYVRVGSYAAAGYVKCTVTTQCNDGNPCTVDSCNRGVCANSGYTGDSTGCSVDENGRTCLNGVCQPLGYSS